MSYSPAWRDWYHLKHEHRCAKVVGNDFESYVEDVLSRHHKGYMNPDPVGRLGDGGCDGIAEMGTIVYAAYGARPTTSSERHLCSKILKDFERARDSWDTMEAWRFVMNGPSAPTPFVNWSAFSEV